MSNMGNYGLIILKHYGSKYKPTYQSPYYGFVAPQLQGTPNHNPYVHPYMG